MECCARQLASLPHAVLVLSPGRHIASVNPAAEQLLGQSLRRVEGRTLDQLVTFEEPRLAQRLEHCDAHLSARGTAIVIAGKGRRRVDAALAPLIDQPGWQILTLHDIGGAEALHDVYGSEGQVSVRAPEVLAHEIKNPLAGIRGAAQLLSRKLGAGDLALTTLIADEVDRIAKLIDQMQTLSRRGQSVLAPCNLHEAVRRACAVIEAGGGGVVIAEEFDPSLPQVQGNGDALVQIMINLLANARDAVAAGSDPRIIVRTRFASGLQLHRGADGAAVRLPIELRISDNGNGVDAAVRDHIFEPFVTTKKSGQGLGLALVRRLVGDMNGRVSLERDEAAGWTHFRVLLPLAAGTAGLAREQVQ